MGAPLLQSLPAAELEPAEVVAWLRQQPAFRAPPRPEDRAATLRPTGFAALDALLGGGLPRGGISEVAGHGGRTSLALGMLAAATARGETVAWIDAADALDPVSVRGAGVRLERFLWIRPVGERRIRHGLKAADLVLDAGGFSYVVLDLTSPGVEHSDESDPHGRKTRRKSRASARDRSAWWVRLGRKVESAGAALICIGDSETFGSALRLQCQRLRGAGFEVRVEIARNRSGPTGGAVTLALAQPVD